MSESAIKKQIDGDHYKTCGIQPIEFIHANDFNFLEGCVLKRLARHRKPTGKGRIDIEKAIHELELILELDYPIDNTNIQYDNIQDIMRWGN